MPHSIRYFGLLLWAAMMPVAALAQLLPDTEVGDVVLRPFDKYNTILAPTTIGHTGIFGLWQGNDSRDPADFFIYDMQGNSGTTYYLGLDPLPVVFASSVTVKKRFFDNFTSINTLYLIGTSKYDGGYVSAASMFSPPITPLAPDIRQRIVDRAQTWVDNTTILTASIGRFKKLPQSHTFRCDSWVEYVMEQESVNNGDGLWKTSWERLIPSPAFYATLAGRREPGHGPSVSVTTIGGGAVNNRDAISSTTITVTATEESTGSGLKQIILVGPTVTTRTVSGLTAVETFSSLADGSYSVRAIDKAGNENSQFGFTIGHDHFLVEGQV